MKCVILQPSYIPWRGYYHQMREADVFVFYDHVQYDSRGWRNRNRIRGPNGSFWLTIPIHHDSLRSKKTKVCQVEIDWSIPWNEKHLRSIVNSYSKAPAFPQYQELLRTFYSRTDRFLADYVIDFTIAIAGELGIRDTEYLRSSELPTRGNRSDRLLQIALDLGADRYLTGPSARAYLDESIFEQAGVSIEYMKYDYPEYEQLLEGFDPQVSILDLMLMKGSKAGEYIW